MGYWDGNKEQEFQLPNGTFLNTYLSQTRIHYGFGQQWITTTNNSLFTYDEGKSHASYFDGGYVPIFLDQEDLVFDNATLGQQARDVCGDNRQCLFDIHTTGKVSIGKASKQAVQSFIAVINETETRGCIPKENKLVNGTVLRNDSEGRMIFRFQCNPGFVLNGSRVISCLHGQWNGTNPSCHQLQAAAQRGVPASEKQWDYYIVGAVAGTGVVLVTAIIVAACFLVRSKCKRHHTDGEQTPSPLDTYNKQSFSYNNPGYASSERNMSTT